MRREQNKYVKHGQSQFRQTKANQIDFLLGWLERQKQENNFKFSSHFEQGKRRLFYIKNGQNNANILSMC